MVSKLVLCLLVSYSTVCTKTPEQDAVRVLRLFEDRAAIDIATLQDLVDREEKVLKCMDAYIKKYKNSYSTAAQNNLYELLIDFERIAGRLAGRQQPRSPIPQQEKIEVVAQLQCDMYYTTGVLK